MQSRAPARPAISLADQSARLAQLEAVNGSLPSRWIGERPRVQLSSPRPHGVLERAADKVVDGVLGATVGVVAKAIHRVWVNIGYVEPSQPGTPRQGSDRFSGRPDRAFEIHVNGGRLHAADGFGGKGFVVSTDPPRSGEPRIQLALPPPGREAEATVEAHIHMHDAPLGFLNLQQAKTVIEEVGRLFDAAQELPSLSTVERQRLGMAQERLAAVALRRSQLEAALEAYPELSRLELMHAVGYRARRGDALDQEFQAHDAAVTALLSSGRLPADIAAQVERDQAYARSKWEFWRVPALISGFYVG